MLFRAPHYTLKPYICCYKKPASQRHQLYEGAQTYIPQPRIIWSFAGCAMAPLRGACGERRVQGSGGSFMGLSNQGYN